MLFFLEAIRMSELVFTYDFNPKFLVDVVPDDFGYLTIAASTEHFSGKGGFWVQWQDVKEFGESLSAYPIDPATPLTASWGFEMQEGDDLILRIEIAPKDSRGNLQVKFEIADQYEPCTRLRASFQTTYTEVDVFRNSIGQLMARKATRAVLTGK